MTCRRGWGRSGARRREGPAGRRRAGWIVAGLVVWVVVSVVAACGLASEARSEESAGTPSLVTAGIDAYTRAMASDDRDERLARFREAERLFAAAIEAGVRNADIETNHGNAALQTGRLGPAVLAYRRALHLDPDHPSARENLVYARGLLPEWVPSPGEGRLADTFFTWSGRVASGRLPEAAAACFALGCLGLAWSILRPVTAARVLAGLFFALFAAAMIVDLLGFAREDDDAGVVIAVEATARAADSINAPRRFAEAVPGGTELRILEDRGDWVQIELHNGRRAWLSASAVAAVVGDDEGRR